jgi:hypothetical protein
VTPTDQPENERDLALRKDIRKSLVDDDALSVNGKNIRCQPDGR